jgi:hypothetical protein
MIKQIKNTINETLSFLVVLLFSPVFLMLCLIAMFGNWLDKPEENYYEN